MSGMTQVSIQQSANLAAQPLSPSSETHQYLTFVLGEEVFAIRILTIKEIIEYSRPSKVPMMPEFVRGVINLRGAVVPVMDLLVRFGGQAAAVAKRTCIVIVELPEQSEHRQVGLVVDAVNAVVEIADADIEPPPTFGARIRNEFINGVGKVGGRFVLILDVRQVVAMEDLETAAAQPEMAPDRLG